MRTHYPSIIFLLLVSFTSFGNTAKPRDKMLADSTIVIINDILIGGNKKTIKKVILRELMFEKGDTVYQENLIELIKISRQNLLNTSLFNYVTINIIDENDIYKSIFILVEERWYLWPNLIFEHADRNLSAFLHEKDWSKVNYGFSVTKFNFRGRREKLKMKFRLGYKEQFQIQYENPMLFNLKRHGMSYEFSWYRQNETSVINNEDKQIYYKEEGSYVLKYYTTGLSYKYRHEYFYKHGLSLNYTFASVNDSIISLNNNYFGNKVNTTQFMTLIYDFDIDKRNYRHYPLNGYKFEIQAKQNGLGLLKNEMESVWEFRAEHTQFFDLSNRWYSGLGGVIRLSSNKKQAYFIESGLGYNDYLRAYEYYVINGQNYFTARSFIKYEIIPTQIKEIGFFSWEKFNKIHYALYANIFFDSGYITSIDESVNSRFSNQFLMSTGIGIDLVAYYDQILRFEYSINREFEHGFFLHIGMAF
ncbi:MAG: hypothetical protein JEZ09_03805 [Salinivirgaceae bacterium]|nr:hypothetical protein [Salinivirgaceae bacterium]